MEKLPEQVRIQKLGGNFKITAVWGLMDVTKHVASDWKKFLADNGWSKVARIWE